MPTLPLRAFQRAPLQRGRAWQSLACDRSDERDAHHIDDTNSACSAGATRRQHRDVLARTGAIALEESEGRKKLRSPLLARHVTANLLQNASSKSMHERWRAARLSLRLSAPCVAWCLFRRRVRCAQPPDTATSIPNARAQTRTMLAEEFIPCFRGAYCYFIDINNDRRFPNTSGVHRGQLISDPAGCRRRSKLVLIRQLNFVRRPARCRRG
jgi:hypothetical protein